MGDHAVVKLLNMHPVQLMEAIATGEDGLLVFEALGQRRGPGCATILVHSMEDPHAVVKLLNLFPVKGPSYTSKRTEGSSTESPLLTEPRWLKVLWLIPVTLLV